MAGTGKLLVHFSRQLKVVVERVGQISVQRPAVGGGNACHIVEGLGTALDLQAVHTGLADQIKERRGAHIIGVEDVAAVLVLADLVQLARTGLLAEIVFPAAGLGTLAAVRVAARHVVGKQASARNAHAHSTVHKGFDLQLRRCFIAQDRNILQGHLTGQHHALCAHVVGGAGRSPVGDACLGGHVHIDVRCKGLAGIQHTKVCHDKGIHTGLGCFLDGLGQAVGFLVGGQGVHGQVDLAAAGVSVDDTLGQLFRRKVGRSRPHSKFRQAAVNGIGTVVDGIAQAFQIACRGQQFRDLQHSSNSSHFSVFTVLFTCAAFWQFALCSLRVRA